MWPCLCPHPTGWIWLYREQELLWDPTRSYCIHCAPVLLHQYHLICFGIPRSCSGIPLHPSHLILLWNPAQIHFRILSDPNLESCPDLESWNSFWNPTQILLCTCNQAIGFSACFCRTRRSMRFQHGSHTRIHLHGGDPKLYLPLVLTGHHMVSITLPFLVDVKCDQHPQHRIPRTLLGRLVLIPSHHPMCYQIGPSRG